MKRKVGFINPGKKFYSAKNTVPDKTALDFWRWAYSDMVQNISRGVLAEYLVACATGTDSEPRDPWESFDIRTKKGTRIEVKTTGFVQVWHYKIPSKNKISPRIGLKPTREYNTATSEMAKDTSWNAEKYVICYHKEENLEKADPMNLDQWRFWVLDRKDIEEELKKRKSTSIAQLKKKYHDLNYNELKDALKGQ